MPSVKLGSTRAVLTICLVALIVQHGGATTTPPPGKRAFEIADYYRTTFVGSPVLSPAGNQVAFSVRHYDLEKGKTWSNIWMMAPDGSGQRQMTSGKHGDGSPSFFPDGKSLLFVSNRKDGQQLYTMPVNGGEPKKLTSFSMGLSDPVISPDGKWIAVTSEVYPECGIDSDANKKIEKTWSEGKLKAHMADTLLYRHWTSWRDGKYPHILLIDAKTGKATKDMTPGNWDSPTFSLGGDRGYAFSPDSKELCFVSNHDKDQASSTNADLWLVPVEGDITEKTARNITSSNRGWDGAPLYSPDGRYIGFRSQETPGYESDLFRISLYDRDSGSVRYITNRQSFDDWVVEIAWTPDSSELIFQADRRGTTPLFAIEIESKAIRQIHAHSNITGWELSNDGKSFTYCRRAIGSPPEIFSVTSRGTNQKQLTRFNADLEKEVDIRPMEEMWVQGDGDYKVHVYIVKPHGFQEGQKYPLILNVHGGPQGMWSDSYRGDWQVYPGKGYVLAFANPTGSCSYGQDFIDAIGGDWGGRVYRDLMKVTDAVEKLPFVDKDRMGAMGWSYGGYMMMWFEGHTNRFKTHAAMMGLFDLRSFYGATEELFFPEKDLAGSPWDSEHYQKWNPSDHVNNFKTPCLIITGEKDYRVPYTQSLQFFTALQKKGIPSRLINYPDAGHWPSWYEMAFYYNAHLDWFHQYLGGEKAPYDMEEFLRNQVFEEKKSEQ